jgi:hypothetical protein
VSYHSPYGPYPRPYYKGHSRKQDERLARELFYGTSAINKEPGRLRSHYLIPGSPHECRAFEALQRLMLFSCRDLSPAILGGLLGSLNPGGNFERRLVFKFRRKGKRPNFAADLDVALLVEGLICGGWKKEGAVQQAMAMFGLSRKAVFAVIKRQKTASVA